jgi:hypothetical protein
LYSPSCIMASTSWSGRVLPPSVQDEVFQIQLVAWLVDFIFSDSLLRVCNGDLTIPIILMRLTSPRFYGLQKQGRGHAKDEGAARIGVRKYMCVPSCNRSMEHVRLFPRCHLNLFWLTSNIVLCTVHQETRPGAALSCNLEIPSCRNFGLVIGSTFMIRRHYRALGHECFSDQSFMQASCPSPRPRPA